jgi:hypothetical protein
VRMANNFPKTEIEFLEIIGKIDQDLKDRSVPIHFRPLHAMLEFSKRLSISFAMVPPISDETPGNYNSATLSFHIDNWYKKRYGDILNIPIGPGSVVTLIKGDPWRIWFPKIFGPQDVICHRDLEKYRNRNRILITKNKLPILNVLNCVEGLTQGIANELNQDELTEISNFFILSFKTLSFLERISKMPFIVEARIDLASSVSHLISKSPHYGLSKWCSLQFVEKLIKCYMKIKDVKFHKTHELNKLSILAQQHGLTNIPELLLSLIQCPASVRYGEVKVSLKEAIDSHHAAIEVCNIVVLFIEYISHLQQ